VNKVGVKEGVLKMGREYLKGSEDNETSRRKLITLT